MSSILKGLAKEDYTGIESGPSSGPFTAEKTPAINPYGGEKDKEFRGAVDESDEDLKETPNENPTGASGEGGRRWYKPKPAGLEEADNKSKIYKDGYNAGLKALENPPKTAGDISHNPYIEKNHKAADEWNAGFKAATIGEENLEEDLHKWFKEKWVRFGPDGKIKGSCARGSSKEGKPKCLPQSKAHNLGKKGRKYAAAKKRREDPNPERSGKAINVATKKKTNEVHEVCPECSGAIYPESMINEKKDACYYKVKSRYKVWPSAYASGALVKCRKKGAKNWGNKSESAMDEAANPAQQAAIAIAMKKAGKKPKHVKEYDEKLGAAELPFTNGQLVSLKNIKDRLLGNKYKITNIFHGGDRVRIVNQKTGKPLTVRLDDIVSLNEAAQPLLSQLTALESGYVQARKATKAIKYLEGEVQQIVVQVQQIAKQSGVDMQAFESAAAEVSQAFNSLESSVYGLDETFKDQISSIQSQIDDSEPLDEFKETPRFINSKTSQTPKQGDGGRPPVSRGGGGGGGGGGPKFSRGDVVWVADLSKTNRSHFPSDCPAVVMSRDTHRMKGQPYQYTLYIMHDDEVGPSAWYPENYLTLIPKNTLIAQVFSKGKAVPYKELGSKIKARLINYFGPQDRASGTSLKESAKSIDKLRSMLMNRILKAHDDLIEKFGEVAVSRVIDEVAEEYGDNQEQSITDADITAFTKKVLDTVLAKDNKIEEGPSIFSGGYSGGAPRLYKAKPAGLEEDKKKDPSKPGIVRSKINKKTGEGIFWTKEGRAAEAADRLGPGPPCVYCGKPSGNHSISFGKKNTNVTHINPGKKTSDGYDDSDADEWGAMFGGMTPAEDHIYTPSPGWKNVTQDEIDFGIRTGVIPEDEYEEKDWEDDIYTRLAKIRERMARVGKKGGHLRVVKELDTWNNAENYKAAPAGLKKESSIMKGLKK